MSDLALAAPRPASAVRDTATMIGRCVRLSRRNVEALITSLALPIMLMLMFVYLFGGAIETGTAYVNYVVPGVILLCAGFGSAATTVSVSQDMHGGVIDRFRSMNLGGTSLIGGHVVASVIRNAASSVLVFGVALAIGFRPHASLPQWLGALGLLAAFMLAISWLAATVGLLASTPDAANGFTFLVMFLPYASSAFVPIATMPGWIHGFARHQPCTPLIESIRALLTGHSPGAAAVTALVWCGGILAVSAVASAIVFRRRTS